MLRGCERAGCITAVGILPPPRCRGTAHRPDRCRGIVIAVVAFLIASPGDDDEQTSDRPTRPRSRPRPTTAHRDRTETETEARAGAARGRADRPHGRRVAGGPSTIEVADGRDRAHRGQLGRRRRDPHPRLRPHADGRARASRPPSASRRTIEGDFEIESHTAEDAGQGAADRAPAGGAGLIDLSRARHRRALGPADPGVAVRLGRGDGAGGLVRGAGGAVARAEARRTSAGGHCPAASAACWRAGRSRSLCGAIGVLLLGAVIYTGLRGHAELDRQLRADLRVRDLLARAGAGERAVRRRLPRVQPVARDRPGRGVGGAARPRAASCRRRSPIPSGSGTGRPRPASSRSPSLELVASNGDRPENVAIATLVYSAAHVRGDGALRGRGLDRARRGVLGVLQPVLAHVAVRAPRAARSGLRRAAVGPARARAGAGHRRRCSR